MELQPVIPDPVTSLPWLSHGLSGLVLELSSTAVIKYPLRRSKSCRAQLTVELQIYKRLGPHPCITKLLYVHKDMIVLERLQYPLRKRLGDLRSSNQRPTSQEAIRWAWQTARGLQHVHSHNVFQIDIGAHNILLDYNEDVKLSDFAGSSIDGSEPGVCPSPHFEHPAMPHGSPTIHSELFALGSTLYEIETTFKPYPEKNDQELEQLFKANTFPDTANLILGEVITKCWMAEYKDAGEVVADLAIIQYKLKGSTLDL